ncbi:unknown [[Clostridium] nexile CAG:348]|nr:unknown [[Clostridium] nexile CAG:348]
MKVKLMKAKLKHVCNQKEFIWGVRVSGLILGIG